MKAGFPILVPSTRPLPKLCAISVLSSRTESSGLASLICLFMIPLLGLGLGVFVSAEQLAEIWRRLRVLIHRQPDVLICQVAIDNDHVQLSILVAAYSLFIRPKEFWFVFVLVALLGGLGVFGVGVLHVVGSSLNVC